MRESVWESPSLRNFVPKPYSHEPEPGTSPAATRLLHVRLLIPTGSAALTLRRCRASCAQAINLDGSSPEAYYLRGEALYKTQNMDQAKKHYQVSVNFAKHPFSADFVHRARNRQWESWGELTAEGTF
jgi:hypothetical protein